MHLLRRRIRHALLFALPVFAIACGGGGQGSNTPVTPATIVVSVSPSSVSLTGASQTAPLVATVTRNGVVDGSAAVQWTTSNANIATVTGTSANATVTSVAPGSATITAQSSGSSGTASVTVIAAPTPTIALSAAPVTIAQGSSGSVTVAITRTAFTAPVTLAVENAPTGVTASFGTAQPNATGETQLLTLAVASTTTPGTSTLTVRGTGQGVTAATTTIALTVLPASFAVALAPSSLTVTQGAAAANSVLRVTRTNLTQPVTVSATGAPTGLSVTFAPASITADSSIISVAASATVAAGSYPITISASVPGFGVQTATLTVTVQNAVVATSVTWQFCALSGIPLWVAVQDGNGAWTQVTSSSTAYTFSLSAGRGGVAYVFKVQNPTFLVPDPILTTYVSTFFGTTAEIVAHGQELCAGANGGINTYIASMIGASSSDYVVGAFGRYDGIFGATVPRTARFVNVQATAPGGTTDLLATRSTISTVNGVNTATLRDIIIRRGVSATATPATIDFTASEAFAPVTRTMTVQNLGTDIAYLFGSYQTANNAYGIYFALGAETFATSLPFPVIPLARQAAADLHVLRLSSHPLGNTQQVRYVYDVAKDPQDRTLTFGPTLSVPTVTSTRSAASFGLSITLPVQSAYTRYFNAIGLQAANGLMHYTQRTEAYATLGTSVVMPIVDFSGVPGFLAEWMLKPGVATDWTVTASGWTGRGPVVPPYDLVNTTPYVDGITYSAAGRSGTITP